MCLSTLINRFQPFNLYLGVLPKLASWQSTKIFTNTATLLGQKIFPNPTEGSFTLTNAKMDDGWEVYNSLGDRVAGKVAKLGENSLRFELSDLPAGVYFLRNFSGQTQRFILK